MWSEPQDSKTEWWITHSGYRWEREVAVVGVRQAKGLLGIGSAVNVAVSAADQPQGR